MGQVRRMRLETRTVARRALSMTSLIDVIFLLLLFFMLTSTFTHFSEIPLIGTTVGASGSRLPSKTIFVRLGTDDLLVQGRLTTMDAMAGLIGPAEDGGQRQVLVSLNGAVTAQRLTDLLVAVARIPDLSVRVLS